MVIISQDDLLLLEGVDSESASELEFNQESMEGDEQEGAVVTTNEVRMPRHLPLLCTVRLL